MKTAVLYADITQKTTAKALASALATGIQKQGADCDLIDVKRDSDTRIAMYQYIAIVATPTTLWGGRIDPAVSAFLKQNGSVAGKRCSAFVSKNSIRKNEDSAGAVQGDGAGGDVSDLFRHPHESVTGPGERNSPEAHLKRRSTIS